MLNTTDRAAVLSLIVIAILATAFAITAMVLYPEMHSKIFRIFFIAFVLFALLLNRFKKDREKSGDKPVCDNNSDDDGDDIVDEFDDLGMTEFWWEQEIEQIEKARMIGEGDRNG